MVRFAQIFGEGRLVGRVHRRDAIEPVVAGDVLVAHVHAPGAPGDDLTARVQHGVQAVAVGFARQRAEGNQEKADGQQKRGGQTRFSHFSPSRSMNSPFLNSRMGRLPPR